MPNKIERTKKWVLLTGASGGVGSACAQQLHSDDYSIVGIDVRQPERSDDFSQFIQHDLTDYAGIEDAIQNLIAERGTPGALVLASGVYWRRPLSDYDMEKARHVYEVNFMSAFNLVRLLAPAMAESQQGSIVFVTSQAGASGGTDPVYAASKGSLTSLMKSIAREFGKDGVRANAVSPGPIDTPMANAMGSSRRNYYEEAIPIKRFAAPSEVASAIAWLVSVGADAVNGTSIDVDGGLTRR